jgi:crotonobetainyl-CoA:carnitine CoA-transferase CaiB-like acyl-CoA transferase
MKMTMQHVEGARPAGNQDQKHGQASTASPTTTFRTSGKWAMVLRQASREFCLPCGLCKMAG